MKIISDLRKRIVKLFLSPEKYARLISVNIETNNFIIVLGSVVTKSILPRVVVGGNTARIISTIEEYIKQNERFNLNFENVSR